MYAQQDPAWRTTRLGAGPDTIGASGCYLTSDADLMTWAGHPFDPPSLNRLYLDNGVYVGGELLNDSALADAFPDLWRLEEVYHCEAIPCDQARLNNDDPNLYVVVEIMGPGGLTHFAPVTDWHSWTIADTWDGQARTIGQRGAAWGWGGDSAALVGKVMRYRYIGGGAGTGPVPTSVPPGSFTGVTAPAGAHVHTMPGLDEPLVMQPPPGDPTIVNGGTRLTFDAWCHHMALGGGDTVPLDSWTGQPDDRWFRPQGTGHWIASGSINGNPPSGMAPVPDPRPPAAPAPPPPPAPPPAPPVLVGPPTMTSYRAGAAVWKGDVPNLTPDRRDRSDGTGWDHPGDPSSALTGPSYDLSRGFWVVMHHMAGGAASADNRFHNAAQQASATYGVLRDGTLWQWVDERDAAWHAGNYGVNVRSIGVEHENLAPPDDTYTAEELATSAAVLADLHLRRGLPLVRGDVRRGVWGVIGHNEVPGAATACPGVLPIDAILAAARALVALPPVVPGPPPVVVPPPVVPGPPPVALPPADVPPESPVGTASWLRALLDWALRLLRVR